MNAEIKANELVNMNYGYCKTQAEAIQLTDKNILTRLCQEIDDWHIHKDEWDFELTKSRLQQMKYWQEVAVEVSKISK
jgi:hypothetical protein